MGTYSQVQSPPQNLGGPRPRSVAACQSLVLLALWIVVLEGPNGQKGYSIPFLDDV